MRIRIFMYIWSLAQKWKTAYYSPCNKSSSWYNWQSWCAQMHRIATSSKTLGKHSSTAKENKAMVTWHRKSSLRVCTHVTWKAPTLQDRTADSWRLGVTWSKSVYHCTGTAKKGHCSPRVVLKMLNRGEKNHLTFWLSSCRPQWGCSPSFTKWTCPVQINLNPLGPSSHSWQSCTQPKNPQQVVVHGIAPSQTQDFPLGFVELHPGPLRPAWQDVSEW